MQAQFPTLYATSEIGLNLTLDLGYYEEAERLTRDGRRRFPGHALFFAVGSVRVAQHRGDLEETIRRCKILRRKFPHAEEGYAIAAKCLSDLGRDDEADVVIGRGVAKCSDDYDLCELHAERATQRRDWPEALRRWNVVWRRFEQIRGLLGAAQCLMEMGRFAEAQKIWTTPVHVLV